MPKSGPVWKANFSIWNDKHSSFEHKKSGLSRFFYVRVFS